MFNVKNCLCGWDTSGEHNKWKKKKTLSVVLSLVRILQDESDWPDCLKVRFRSNWTEIVFHLNCFIVWQCFGGCRLDWHDKKKTCFTVWFGVFYETSNFISDVIHQRDSISGSMDHSSLCTIDHVQKTSHGASLEMQQIGLSVWKVHSWLGLLVIISIH